MHTTSDSRHGVGLVLLLRLYRFDGVQGKHFSVASWMELGGQRGSFSLSPTAHYTRSNDDVIYYLHGCVPTLVPLEPCSNILHDGWLCCAVPASR